MVGISPEKMFQLYGVACVRITLLEEEVERLQAKVKELEKPKDEGKSKGNNSK